MGSAAMSNTPFRDRPYRGIDRTTAIAEYAYERLRQYLRDNPSREIALHRLSIDLIEAIASTPPEQVLFGVETAKELVEADLAWEARP
jgi:hypothetical protein